MSAVGIHLGGALKSGVAAPVADGVVDAGADAVVGAGGPESGGVVIGAGLVAEAQAATSMLTTIVGATRESEDGLMGCRARRRPALGRGR
jgi:hypothetical protein